MEQGKQTWRITRSYWGLDSVLNQETSGSKRKRTIIIMRQNRKEIGIDERNVKKIMEMKSMKKEYEVNQF